MNRLCTFSFRTATLLLSLMLYTAANAQDNYRTAASGNWNTPIWQKDNAGNGSYTSTALSPDSSSRSITIMSGHTVQVTSAVVADSRTVASGGTLNLAAPQTITT